MEISEIQKVKSVGQLKKKEGVEHTSTIKDSRSTSSECIKKAEWVKMLKEMPDVRPEKVTDAIHASPTSHELAQKILDR